MPALRRIVITLIAAATALAAPAASGPALAASASGGHKLLVFVEENHSQSQALARMPYLASLAKTYGRAVRYKAITHPSLPNYLAIVGGSTFGVTEDIPPSAHHVHGKSVFDQTLAMGRSARTYAQSMPGNCRRTNAGPYLVRHNPWAYFSDPGPTANCKRFDVPAGNTSTGNLRHDIQSGTLPATGFVIPDACHDAHNPACGLAGADAYLKAWMQVIKAGPDWKQGRLTVIVTFDEDDRSSGNSVAFVVADPRLHGKVVTLAANHYSLTRWLDANIAAP